MKALILAAGQGTRLFPHTKDKPKCMVEFQGKPMFEWQLDSLEAAGINDINVVTGYKKEAFLPYQDRLNQMFHNDQFESNNMVASLMYAKELFDDDLIVSYSDIVYSPDIVKKLIQSKSDFSIVVDHQWQKLWEIRLENPLDDAESLKLDSQNHILEIGQKASSLEEIQGQYIGLMKFSPKALVEMSQLYELAQEGTFPWEGVKSIQKAYMTDLLMALIKKNKQLKSIPIDGGWLEIDSTQDLENYNQYILENNKHPFTLFK